MPPSSVARSRIPPIPKPDDGRSGPAGVAAALALNAQRDARSAADYQGKAVEIALRRKGQDMVDALLAECLDG